MVRRLVFVLSLLAALPAFAQAPEGGAAAGGSPSWRTEDVRYRNGSLNLAALLMLPRSGAPVAGAVIVQGSGTSFFLPSWRPSPAG